MVFGNQTRVTEFMLLGFEDFPNLQLMLFLMFLVIYLVSLNGNLLILALVISDQHLHTPMYFFLGNLSFLEACSSSSILPRMLLSLWTGEKRISFSSCFAQWYIGGSLLITECCLLSVMSYDRYLAICKPLHYATSMNTQTCIQLAAASWISVFIAFLLLLILMLMKLNYCGPNVINTYFCDYSPLLKLSCSDPTLLEIIGFIVDCIFVVLPFLLILASYVYIIASIMRIPSTTGRQKAFSTCSSHLVVVCIFYGSIIIVYLFPKTEEMRRAEKFYSLLYIVLPSLANPFVYSLRNKDVKNAFKMILTGLYNPSKYHKANHCNKNRNIMSF